MAFGALAGLVACGGEGVDEYPDDVETSRQQIQRTYLLDDHVSVVNRAALSSTRRHVFDSQGVVRVRLPGGLQGSCGATFVSPHFAMTSAHCVNGYRPDVDEFSVERVRFTGTDASVSAASVVAGGLWPDRRPSGTLTAEDGYSVTTWNGCKLRRNCSYDFGPRHRCPGVMAFPEPDADIALIECPARAAGSAWVSAAGTGAAPYEGKAVEIWWFHEVLSMGTEPPLANAPARDHDRWAHYALYTPDERAQNYHYTRKHQLLPLVSRSWPDGTPYRITAARQSLVPFGDKLTLLDTPVCHGTSGAGVFVADTGQYLGPIAVGDGTIAGRLCASMKRETPGGKISGVPEPHYAAILQSADEIWVDRGSP